MLAFFASGIFLFVLMSGVTLLLRGSNRDAGDFGSSLIARHSVFYLLGIFTKMYYDKINRFCNKTWYIYLPIWFLFASFWTFEHKPTFISSPNLLVEMGYYYITAIAGIAMMFSIGIKFINQETHNRTVSCLIYFGENTFGLYAIHTAFLMPVLYRIIAPYAWGYITTVSFLFFVSTIISMIMVKIIEKGELLPILLLGKTLNK